MLALPKFEAGSPACPIACKYCSITEHEQRRELWNRNPVAGINKASTFINVTPWINDDPDEQRRFHAFPWHLLKGDFVGFTAITDPFWPKLDRYLWEWCERAGEVAKLITCVTKWPISRETLKRIATVPNFFLVVSITGNESLENTSVSKQLGTLSLCREYGVKTLPICHPYISGISDLSFLSKVKELGFDNFDVKGLRYCNDNMASWMPEASKRFYISHEEEEILPEDGWIDRLRDSGLTLLSPREWYEREAMFLTPRLGRDEAEHLVDQILELANVVSSDKEGVRGAAIRRRM